MSQLNNVITTTFRARGNQAISTMGTVAQGFGAVGRAINENTRLSERLNNQWRAFGTTIRYALAGSVVFGLTRMVGQLRDVQQQLGLIQAIGSQPGGGGLFGLGRALDPRQVTAIGNALQTTALNSLTPLTQVNDAAINFLSTVQNVEPSELPRIIEELAEAARFAQTPVEDLTKAATTMNIAFGRRNNFQNISEFSRQFFALTAIAPGGRQAGAEITTQLGPLSSIFQLAPGRDPRKAQAQAMSLVLGSLRFGGSPATGVRGLTFFLQSLVQPASAKAREALTGIGITPEFVQKEGLYAAAMKFLRHVQPARDPKRIAGIDDDTLSQIGDEGNLPGIPAAQSQFLRTALGRIHGVRAAVVLASQLHQRGDVQSLPQLLSIMQAAQDDQLQGALNMSKQWENFRKRARLQDAANAIQLMSLQVAQIFEPVLNFAADRVTGAASAMQHHRRATRNIGLGGAGVLAALGVGAVLGGRSLLRRIPGFGGGIGNALVRGNAIQAALTNSGTLGGSPQNPMYVVIVGQLFGGGGMSLRGGSNTGGGGGGGGAGGTIANTAETYTGYRLGRRVLGRAGGLLSRFGRRVGGFADEAAVRAGTAGFWESAALHTGLKLLGPTLVAEEYFRNADPTQRGEQEWIRQNRARISTSNLLRAQQIWGQGVSGAGNFAVGTQNGHAEVWLTINVMHPDGKVTKKRVHVPVRIWQGGRYPSAGGKPTNRRSG